MHQESPGAQPLAFTDAERAVMPGLAAATSVSIEEELLLASLVARLQRTVTDTVGDRVFLRSVRGRKISMLSEAQRKNVMRLAWRYRFQLPPVLRPGADPDKQNDQKVT
jgi:hypothetical protein